jgi:hypothetical protein
MYQSEARQIIERVLAEHGGAVDALAMLAVLVEALVERHVDVELRRAGRREPYPIHNERADALKAANDALHQQAHVRQRGLGGQSAAAVAVRKEALRAVMAVLVHCQFAAEKAAGIGESDDDDDRGPRGMRLVRE